MITLQQLDEAITQYNAEIVPAMLRSNYHLILVKGGKDYSHLSEQSHFAHIINGVFGFAQLVRFLIQQKIVINGLDDLAFRQTLALFTIHEVHKDHEVEKLGNSEFGIPLERLQQEYNSLGLERFAEVDRHLMRAANVHKRSPRQGDLQVSDNPRAARLWLYVRIADTMASVRTPEEAAASLHSYLSDLSPVFVPHNPPGRYALYYHRIPDLRGVLTNTLHQAVSQLLQEMYGWFPLLHFVSGTLYVGSAPAEPMSFDQVVQEVREAVMRHLVERGAESTDAIRAGIRKKDHDVEKYVYSFADPPALLEVIKDDCCAIKKPDVKIFQTERVKLFKEGRKSELPAGWSEVTLWERLEIDKESSEMIGSHTARCFQYLLYADGFFRALNPSGSTSSMEWLMVALETPERIRPQLREIGKLWATGGLGKYVLPIAYHFLQGPEFADRPAGALPHEDVLERLHQRVLAAFREIDTATGRRQLVAGMGLREDLTAYLKANLQLSFSQAVQLDDDGLAAHIAPRRKGHTGRLCSLCNRSSPFTSELRTGILDDFGRVFSNRVLPALEAPSGMRLWCPVCQLEFILRKLSGMGLPPGADYGKSQRINLYVLPTFSFTPDHIRMLDSLLQPFRRVTSLPIRDYGATWGLPHYWLQRRSLDPEWLVELADVLEREAEKIAGWGGADFVGERITLGPIQSLPHYYLLSWEKAASSGEKKDERIATRTEAWAKAVFVAAALCGLTSCKVYVTEQPYIPDANPASLRSTITLDSPPPAIRALLGGCADTISLYGREQGARSGLEDALDAGAAMWMVTTEVHAPDRQTKDKHIAGRLSDVNSSVLAGATFYKEYARLNEGQTPPPPLVRACEVLLEIAAKNSGGKLMNLVEQIAQKSLEIAWPLKSYGRGKAHSYELVFREAIVAMRKAQQVLPEMRLATLSQTPPSAETIAELKYLAAGTLLKGLERRHANHRGEIRVRAWGAELTRLVGEFVDILVEYMYLQLAGGSFAAFLRLENSIADGIFYYTDRHLPLLWAEYNKARELNKAKSDTSEFTNPN